MFSFLKACLTGTATCTCLANQLWRSAPISQISWYGDGEMQPCQGCHFQFDIDFSFTLVQFKWFISWRDRNIKLILMSGSYRCHLRQVLTPAERKTYCTHSLGPTLQRLTFSAGCIFNMQYFDFEAALTKGCFWSIVKALYHKESKQCLSIHLPCLSLTFSQPWACIDNPFPFFLFHPVLTLQPTHWLSHTHTVHSYWPSSSTVVEGLHS